MNPHRDATLVHRRDDPRSLDELISVALGEPEEHTAWDAIFCLRERGSREVLERASALCRSFCPFERKLAAAILGQLGCPNRTFPEECLTLLLAMLDIEQEESVLSSILIALGHLRDPRSMEPAAKFRDHANPEVRYGVVHAIRGHEDPLAVAVLIALTSDPEAKVRDWACFELGSQIKLDTPELRDALADRLADEHDDTRCEALLGLAERRDERVIPILLEALASESVWSLEIEAAAAMADPRLHAGLVDLRGWWDVDESLLEEAIEACSPPLDRTE